MNPGDPAAAQRGPQKIMLGIQGMTCDHCRRRVEQALRGASGVVEARVEWPAGTAEITFHPGQTSPDQLQVVVRKAGYQTTDPR